ncbi:MAG: type IX secretion system sortase PorU [Flavobacteriaceae bacterium]|nr:type IX secretion system sortase PorU [Flavobacteriaceae bacterium]
MIKKGFFSLLLVICGTGVSFAQQNYKKDFKLHWTKPQIVLLSNEKQLKIPLTENNVVNENLVPTYTSTWQNDSNIQIVSFYLSHIKYSPLNSPLPKSVLSKLSSEVITNLNNISAANTNEIQLYIEPLVKKGNAILKVESFTLNYSGTSNTFRNSQKTAVQNSVLANGTWYKFAVDTTGVFKIDVNFLKGLGINTSNLNPDNIRIFGNGGALLPQKNSSFRNVDLQENALYVDSGNDAIFNNNDFVLFYAKGPDSWNVDPSIGSINHIKNIYSDAAYYFITIDNGAGKHITTPPPITANASLQINTFNDYIFHEKEAVNLFAIGQQWFGESFSIDNTQQINFTFTDVDISVPIKVKTRAVVSSSVTSQLQVQLNNNPLYNLSFFANTPGSLTLASASQNIAEATITDDNIALNLTYNNGGNPSARSYLDYIEISGMKHLIARHKQFSFRNFEAAKADANTVVSYTISNSENIFQVWDVTDFLNPKIITNQSASADFSFNAQGGTSNGTTQLSEYIVLNNTDFFSPTKLANSKIPNQNLHALQNIDYLIITRNNLIDQASRLANYHKLNNNYTTAVIDVKQIFNEFGSGSPDLTSIRDFIKYLYDNATSSAKKIKFVTLFGDTSYDFKDRITNNNNIIPAFQSLESFNLATSYVTDDYYGMMDANEGLLTFSDKQDVATGRYPITTVQEAKAAVDKTLNYYGKKAFGDWRNLITVVADDPDKASEFVLQETVERISDNISLNKPIFNLKKIYADAYKQQTSAGGERYPDVNIAITTAVENGTLVIDYYGHGGEDGWANERILGVSQIQGWVNPNTLPLFITVTCEFAKLDNPLRLTAGEFVFNNPQGGATSLITTTREIFISVGQAFNENLVTKLFAFNGENQSVSQALMTMKNNFTTSQRLFVYYFGDPALKLAQPSSNILITKMNDVLLTQAVDTLKALSHVSFEGVVTNENNQVLTDFNGVLSTTIFDKSIDKTTLDNNNFGRKLTFDALESKIYRGRSTVTNGTFKFDFIVPKDIRVAFGKGKMSFYADNKIIDKAGYNFDITIGGINKNAAEDNQGPNVSLFMNDESFLDGGNTNQSPLFIASLEDASGINTSLTAVDHDIIAILDGDQSNPIILNDFYQTELDSFKKGKVNFQLRNLSTGIHTIKFKAWDTYNNLSEASLTFNVVADNGITLNHVLNYPNPFVNYTEFWFEHNRPNEALEVQIQIFTISGKLVKTINKSLQTSGTLSRDIIWNGLDDYGAKIGKGVYIYKLTVKSSITQDKAEKIEKLVILR